MVRVRAHARARVCGCVGACERVCVRAGACFLRAQLGSVRTEAMAPSKRDTSLGSYAADDRTLNTNWGGI